MLETSARLLRLLALLQSRRFWPGADLATRLEVSERTVRRDVDRLRSLGYPVESSTGVAGGYQLGAGSSMPPLLLEDDEALAVALGLRTATSGSVSGLEHAAPRALAKLDQVLPKRLRRRIANLHAAVSPLYWTGNPQVSADTLSLIANASRSYEGLQFRYADRSGRKSLRTVEPCGLVHTGARWYLVAWDDDRKDWRTFRVDRLHAPRLRGKLFTPRDVPGGDLAAYVSSSIANRPQTFHARVVLRAPHREVVERVPPLAAHVEPVDAQSCMLVMGTHSLASLVVQLGLLGVPFEVHDPPELASELRRMATLFERAIDASATSRTRIG